MEKPQHNDTSTGTSEVTNPSGGGDAGAQRAKIAKLLNRNTIRKGIIYFVLFTVAGLAALFFYNQTPNTLGVLTRLKPAYMLVALAMAFLDLWIGGWRNHIFARVVKPGVSPWLCFRANLANMFMGAVTPSQTGGAPAQLYIMYRGGISFADSLALSFINFISTLAFFPIAAGLAMLVVSNKFSEGVLLYLLRYGFVIFFSLFAIVVVALLRPDWIGKLVYGFAKLAAKLSPKRGGGIRRFGEKTMEALEKYRQNCNRFLVQHPWLMPYSFLLTILLYFNKFALAYCLLLGMGIEADFWTVIALQAVIMFILYFSPSPGGGGIAELSIAGLMSSIIPDEALNVFTLLFRFFLTYLPAAIGAYVVLDALKSQADESEPLAGNELAEDS